MNPARTFSTNPRAIQANSCTRALRQGSRRIQAIRAEWQFYSELEAENSAKQIDFVRTEKEFPRSQCGNKTHRKENQALPEETGRG